MTETGKVFWGKYRARVADEGDPYRLGRLKLLIPDVLGTQESGWALPSFPLASAGSPQEGGGVGLFLVPRKGAWVWAEFEQGNPDRPIWTGCFFPADETALVVERAALAPLNGIDPKKAVLKFGHWLITADKDSISVQHLVLGAPRTRLKIDGKSLKLSTEQAPAAVAPTCATLEMSANKVAVNGTALEVT